MERRDDPVEVWTIAIDADTRPLQSELRSAASIGRQFSNALVGAFEGIAIKGRDAGDVVRSFGLKLSEIALKAALRPLEQGFGNLIAGLIGGGGFGFAKGGVVNQGLPVPFASGGVIQSPIAFPLAGGRTGLAGEAGPEAILPLRRGADGRLGVAAPGGRGGGVAVTFNIATPDADSFRRSEAQVSAMLARAVSFGNRVL